MNEKELAEKLHAYRDSLGTCTQAPSKRVSSKWILALSPVAIAATLVLAVAVWPKDASAAELRRLQNAITNARSMTISKYAQVKGGKWVLWTKTNYDSGRWRDDYGPKQDSTMIFKGGLCYTFRKADKDATVRPASVAFNPPPKQGEALQVVERELSAFMYSHTDLKASPFPDVQGKPAYQVNFEDGAGATKVQLVVDKQTDLPIYANLTYNSKFSQRAREEYQFNVDLQANTFEVPPSKRLIDVSKSILEFKAAHSPLAGKDGVKIIDACSVEDGTVWIAALNRDLKTDVLLKDFKTNLGSSYANVTNLSVVTDPSTTDRLHIIVFTPIDPFLRRPTRCSATPQIFSFPKQTSETRGTPGKVIETLGAESFPVRTESGAVPTYFAGLGAETGTDNLHYEIAYAKSISLEAQHRYAQAGRIWEGCAKEATPNNPDAYVSDLDSAIREYQKANFAQVVSRLKKQADPVRKHCLLDRG